MKMTGWRSLPLFKPLETLRAKLVLLVIAAIIPLLAMALFNAWRNANAAVARATDQLQFSASLVAANQLRVTESARQTLTAIAHVPGLLEKTAQECHGYLKELREQLPMYRNLGVIGLDGRFLCSSMGGADATDVSDRDYFMEAKAGDSFAVGSYTLGRLTGRPVLPFAIPMRDAQDRVVAVAFASLDLNELSKSFTSADLPQSSRVMVMDRDGVILAVSAGAPSEVGEKIAHPLFKKAVHRMLPGVADVQDVAGGQHIVAFNPVGASRAGLFVTVSSGRDDVLEPVEMQLHKVLLVLSLVASLGGMIAWRMASRAVVEPTTKILEAIRALEGDKLNTRLPATLTQDGGEMSRLASGINQMADALQHNRDTLERELDHSQAVQQKLQEAQRLARIAYWQIDLETAYVWWSDEVHEVLGIERGSASNRLNRLLRFIHPADRRRFRQARLSAFKSEEVLDIELRIIASAGDTRWVHVRSRIDGPAKLRSGTVQDITEQHQAQDLLRLLETCISRLNDMVIITDAGIQGGPGQRIVFVNEAFERRTGYTRAEALGCSPRFLDGLNTQRSELDRIRTAVRSGKAVRVELINYTKSGEEFWVDRDMVPISDAEGKLTHWVAVARDITQKKQSEQALLESEQRYVALFDSAPISMWVFDQKTLQFLAANKAAQDCYGYSLEEFLSMSVLDIRPREEWSRIHEHLAQNDFSLNRGTWLHCRKDGSTFSVDIVSQQIQYAGRSASFIAAQDVSARVKAEKDAQEYLYTLQRAADAAQAITWHQTLAGTLQEIVEQARGVVGAHQAWLNLGGNPAPDGSAYVVSVSEKYGPLEALACPADDGVLGELVMQTNRALRLTQASLEEHPRGSNKEMTGQTLVPFRGWLGVPLTDRNGSTLGVLQLSDKYDGEFTPQDEYVAIELAHLASATVENTRLLQEIGQLNASLEQKVFERTAALAHQEALFRAVAEQAPEVIWTVDPAGGVSFVNRTWLGLIGGEQGDWTGHQWSKVVHPEDLPSVMASWNASQATHLPFSGTRRVRAIDGSWHTMSYRGSPVFDENGNVVFWVGIDTDITEIKAIEDALRLSNRELEAFSYSVSHDLRSPLNTVDGFSRLLAKQLDGQATEKVQHYLSRIQAGVGQMGQLIEDLLSLAQVTRTELRQEVVNLSALARDVFQDLQTRQPERRVSTSIEEGLEAPGDSRLIKVVLENLLGNAWKFSAHQSQSVISVGRMKDESGTCVFFVRDNGVGFDMAYANKLFKPFQRLHAVTEFEGTGVGLATCSRVIERHGGRIWVEALPNRGATFFFTLPKVPGKGAEGKA